MTWIINNIAGCFKRVIAIGLNKPSAIAQTSWQARPTASPTVMVAM
jgi:hypothetical protein